MSGHGGSTKPERMRKLLPFDSADGIATACRGLGPAKMGEKEGKDDEKEQTQGA